MQTEGDSSVLTDARGGSDYITGPQPLRLGVVAYCWVGPGANDHLPSPSFTATFNFSTTRVGDVAGTPFN